jgi:hypothetical protein
MPSANAFMINVYAAVAQEEQPARAALVLVNRGLRQPATRDHHERARAEPGQGQGAIPALAEVPHGHGLGSSSRPFSLSFAENPRFCVFVPP